MAVIDREGRPNRVIAVNPEFGPRVCRALGLDPEQVRNLHIILNAGEVVYVQVEGYVHEAEGEALLNVLTDYRLCDPVVLESSVVPPLEDDTTQSDSSRHWHAQPQATAGGKS